MQPKKLQLVDNKYLVIEWEDNSELKLSLHKMRMMCPCAICSELRLNQGKSYIPFFLTDQIRVSNIEMVGNYAIKIDWKDGHSTGIYEFSSLQKYVDDKYQAEV